MQIKMKEIKEKEENIVEVLRKKGLRNSNLRRRGS
jgi:hypothetical protein